MFLQKFIEGQYDDDTINKFGSFQSILGTLKKIDKKFRKDNVSFKLIENSTHGFCWCCSSTERTFLKISVLGIIEPQEMVTISMSYYYTYYDKEGFCSSLEDEDEIIDLSFDISLDYKNNFAYVGDMKIVSQNMEKILEDRKKTFSEVMNHFLTILGFTIL